MSGSEGPEQLFNLCDWMVRVAMLRGVITKSESSVERYYRGMRTRCYHKMFQARWREVENAFPRYINAICNKELCNVSHNYTCCCVQELIVSGPNLGKLLSGAAVQLVETQTLNRRTADWLACNAKAALA